MSDIEFASYADDNVSFFAGKNSHFICTFNAEINMVVKEKNRRSDETIRGLIRGVKNF